MLSLLIRILLFILVLWLLQRVLGSILKGSGGRASNQNVPAGAQRMVKDPVCGMYMDLRLAKKLEHKGKVLYFCSEECKKRYLSGSSPTNDSSQCTI